MVPAAEAALDAVAGDFGVVRGLPGQLDRALFLDRLQVLGRRRNGPAVAILHGGMRQALAEADCQDVSVGTGKTGAAVHHPGEVVARPGSIYLHVSLRLEFPVRHRFGVSAAVTDHVPLVADETTVIVSVDCAVIQIPRILQRQIRAVAVERPG